MEKCSHNQQHTAAVICQCQTVPLCFDCLPIHMKQVSGTHITIPIDIYNIMQDEVGQFIDKNRESFDHCSQFAEKERQQLAAVETYKSNLKSKAESVKKAVCT